MIDILQREFLYLWYYSYIQIYQIWGYYLFGIVLGSVISVFGKQQIHALFRSLDSKKLGVWGLIPASILGIASPLCMFGTIPISASFAEKGMKDDMLAAFMMSSILLNPQLIIYSASLGIAALVVRIIASFVGGVVAGLSVRYFYKGSGFFCFDGLAASKSRDTDPNLLLRLIKNIGRNIKATGLYFVVGIFLSACFTRYVPAELIANLFGSNRSFGVIMAATIGVPLYACGGGTIPLIQGWLASGMSLGSAAAFMITGPATKITNLGALKIVLGIKNFLLYLVFVVALALVTGLIVNFVIG